MHSVILTNVWYGLVLAIATAGIAVSLAFALRRWAPPGGYFTDNARTAGVLTSLATLFSVLFALVILLSVEAYKDTQAHANAEADSLLKEFQLADSLPARTRFALQTQLICYGRGVQHLEWSGGTVSGGRHVVDDWASNIDAAASAASVSGPVEQAAFQLLLQESLQRQQERTGRQEGATGALPAMVWPILILGALGLEAFVILNVDRRESAAIQAFQVGVATLLLASSLLLINALNHPFSATPGRISDDYLVQAIAQIESRMQSAIDARELTSVLPCDSRGAPFTPMPKARAFPPGSNLDLIARSGRLRVGVSDNTPLFGELDPISGVHRGFDIELAAAIADELGFSERQIDFVPLGLDNRVAAIQSGQVDLVVMTFSITPERQDAIGFSKPYYIAGQSLLVRRNDRSISSVRDLSGKTVCVTAGTTAAEFLPSANPEAILVSAASTGECVSRLLAGNAQAVSDDDVVLAGFAAEDDGLVLSGGQLTTELYGVGVPKGDTVLASFVDSVIDATLNDGRWGSAYYRNLSGIPGLDSAGEARQRLVALRH